VTRTFTVLAAAGSIAVAAIATPTTAEAGGLRMAGGIFGGAFGTPFYGFDGPYSGGPYYAYVARCACSPVCYWHRERFFDGFRWRMRRVQVCP